MTSISYRWLRPTLLVLTMIEVWLWFDGMLRSALCYVWRYVTFGIMLCLASCCVWHRIAIGLFDMLDYDLWVQRSSLAHLSESWPVGAAVFPGSLIGSTACERSGLPRLTWVQRSSLAHPSELCHFYVQNCECSGLPWLTYTMVDILECMMVHLSVIWHLLFLDI